MYSVSNDFLEAVRQPIIEYEIDGTINEEIEFDSSNIVSGSFHITNQCSTTDDVVLGSVYTGTLTVTLTGITSVRRYTWVDSVIVPTFHLKLADNSWESVPLGVYTVKEAKHSAEGVMITAYDDMIKLDEKFDPDKFTVENKMYQHLQIVCQECGVTLGMSEAQIQALTNGDIVIGIVGTGSCANEEFADHGNDIDTYRDFVFWAAQTMACYATIDRSGNLVFRQFQNENHVVDTVTEEYRLKGAVFDDYTTNYVGFYIMDSQTGGYAYYGYDIEYLEDNIARTTARQQAVIDEMNALTRAYQQGQITWEEYQAAMKPLKKQKKKIDKRLEWLGKALAKAENSKPGTSMNLGENPMLQADGVGATQARMRKNVLARLDEISYTPFTCSTVVGVHYDLGDIIQFTGGHATEDGETCCLMMYDFTMHGEYQMQGFGVDPIVKSTKSSVQKTADKANKNASNAIIEATGGGGGGISYQTSATNNYEFVDYTEIS